MAEEWSPIVISATFTPATANVGDSVLLQVIVLDVQTIDCRVSFRVGRCNSCR